MNNTMEKNLLKDTILSSSLVLVGIAWVLAASLYDARTLSGAGAGAPQATSIEMASPARSTHNA